MKSKIYGLLAFAGFLIVLASVGGNQNGGLTALELWLGCGIGVNLMVIFYHLFKKSEGIENV